MTDVTTKRYLAFGGYNYYPTGGFGDFRGAFDTIEEAEACLVGLNDGQYKRCEWGEIIDMADYSLVKELKF